MRKIQIIVLIFGVFLLIGCEDKTVPLDSDSVLKPYNELKEVYHLSTDVQTKLKTRTLVYITGDEYFTLVHYQDSFGHGVYVLNQEGNIITNFHNIYTRIDQVSIHDDNILIIGKREGEGYGDVYSVDGELKFVLDEFYWNAYGYYSQSIYMFGINYIGNDEFVMKRVVFEESSFDHQIVKVSEEGETVLYSFTSDNLESFYLNKSDEVTLLLYKSTEGPWVWVKFNEQFEVIETIDSLGSIVHEFNDTFVLRGEDTVDGHQVSTIYYTYDYELNKLSEVELSHDLFDIKDYHGYTHFIDWNQECRVFDNGIVWCNDLDSDFFEKVKVSSSANVFTFTEGDVTELMYLQSDNTSWMKQIEYVEDVVVDEDKILVITTETSTYNVVVFDLNGNIIAEHLGFPGKIISSTEQGYLVDYCAQQESNEIFGDTNDCISHFDFSGNLIWSSDMVYQNYKIERLYDYFIITEDISTDDFSAYSSFKTTIIQLDGTIVYQSSPDLLMSLYMYHENNQLFFLEYKIFDDVVIPTVQQISLDWIEIEEYPVYMVINGFVMFYYNDSFIIYDMN